MIAAKMLVLLAVGFFTTMSCASANSVNFSYVVAPQSVTPGDSFTVFVGLQANNPTKTVYLVSVRIWHSSKVLIDMDGPRKIQSGAHNAFLLKIPADAEPGQHTLVLTLTNATNIVANKTLPITVRGNNRIVLIQTDKPIYKPGETVKGRVIVLTRDMTSAEGAVTVTIQNPQSYTMGKLPNISLSTGVGPFEFPLSSEPVLGTYECCATYEGLPRGQKSCFTFEVKRYVLPKFSCSITPVDEVVGCGPRKICFSVSADYTYGQSVKGIVSATVRPSYDWYRCPTGEETVTSQIHGKADVCVAFCSRYRYCWGDVIIDANVTDPTSDTAVQCEGQTTVPVRSVPYKLKILEEDRAFTPCHFTTVKVLASTLTGKPMYANVSLTGDVYKRNKKRCRSDSEILGPFYQETDKYGIATFQICMSCQTLEVSFRAEVVDDDNTTDLFSSAYSHRSMIWSPGRIALSTNETQIEVGNTAKITASFSTGKKAEYYVVSKGLIVARGDCIAKRDKYIWSKHKQICKRGGVRWTCIITIDVNSFMAPKFTVIVSQKMAVASRIVIEVIPDSSAQVSLEFQREEVRPGDETSLTIRASPKSFIGVVAVDKSVYIQQEKNQLTTSKLYNEAGKFDEHKPLPSESFICSWNMVCPCECYGRYPRPTVGTGQPPNSTIPPIRLRPPIRPLPILEAGADMISPEPSGRPDKCCPRNCTNPTFYPIYCSYFKASSYFLASGIQMYDSDFSAPVECPKPNPPTRPKVTYDCCYPIFYYKYDFVNDRVAQPVAVENNAEIAESRAGGDDLVNPSRVRQYFPETWLWFEHTLGDKESSLVEKVTVPDTITSWVADAFAVSQTNAMTIARPATLTVFQPFFVTINLPYSVIRGELVEITVTIFNYLQNKTTAYVDLLVKDEDLRIVRGKDDRTTLKSGSRPVEVPAGEGAPITYYLLPLRNGYLPIQATVRSQTAADSVIRNLLVEPEGVKEEYSQSALMCVNGSDIRSPGDMCVNQQFNVSLPLDYIPDSESATVSVTANYMGPTIDGLDNLLRLPTGCGEQNMLNFAPAVYIARYLDTVGQLTAEIRKKALLYMQTGYQREMTYQRADGSYSAFGDNDQCGSMWLTAFVVRSFAQADGLIQMSIDPKVQDEAIDFILDHQNPDGSFPPVCKPLHKEMQGCSGGNCSLTAYVTLALLEAGVSPKTKAVSSALEYLSTNCIPSDCSNIYTLALVAYTMRKGSRSGEAQRALSLLKSCAVTDGDHTYWQYKKTPSCVDYGWSYYCRPRSCDVETTAYALLAFTSTNDVAYSLGIVRWLIEQRNPRGGFKSTQDTVVALQALSEYATLTVAGGCVSANVYLSAPALTHKVTVDSGNAMQIQTVQLPKIPTVLDVRVCNVCCILVSVGVKYNVPQPDETAAFDVTALAVKQKSACKYEVRVCNRWISNDADSSNMAVSEVTFFSGFLPVQSELKQLQKLQQCMIKRIDFKGRVLSVYFEEVTQTQCCFTVTMKRASVVEDLQGVPIITYNYYEPDQRGGTMLYPREEC